MTILNGHLTPYYNEVLSWNLIKYCFYMDIIWKDKPQSVCMMLGTRSCNVCTLMGTRSCSACWSEIMPSWPADCLFHRLMYHYSSGMLLLCCFKRVCRPSNQLLFFISGHPYFVAVQYHPEYISRPMKPSAPYLGLVLASINRLNTYIARGCRLSPRNSFSDTESSDTEEEMAALMSKSLSFTSQESSPQQL